MPLFRRNRRIDLTEQLYEACRQHPSREEEITRLLDRDPNAARVTDEYGNSMLHVVCSRRGISLQVVLALLRANPSLASQVNPRDGSLPLHRAAASHAKNDVIQMLLTSYPAAVKVSDHRGNLPLHEACSAKAPFEVCVMLSQTWPEAVQRPNEEKSLPLHLACTVTPATFDSKNEISYEVIWSLLEMWPDAVMERDSNGDTPYELLKAGAPQQADLLQLMRTKRAIAQMPEHERKRYLDREKFKSKVKSMVGFVSVIESNDASTSSTVTDLSMEEHLDSRWENSSDTRSTSSSTKSLSKKKKKSKSRRRRTVSLCEGALEI